MFRKTFFTSLLAALMFLICSAAVFAQNAPVTGRVQLKKSDGSFVPVPGALVEVFRVDIKASYPTAKTDKKGNFAFAGLPLGSTLVLSVSSPGAKPGYLPNVRPGAQSENLLISLDEGDGKRWTEEQIRAAIAESKGSTSTTTSEKQPSAEDKKAQAEYEKKVAEANTKNEDIKNKNTVIQKSLEEGNAAFKAKDYAGAIAHYTAGINADPEYVGSAPILLNNRAVVLKLRAIDSYNASVKAADPEKTVGMAKAKDDLEAALDSYNKSWTVLKNAAPADIANPANHEKSKYEAVSGLTEVYRLLVLTKADPAKATESKEAFDAYFQMETDAAKKAKVQLTYADMMRDAGDSAKAIEGYRTVLQNSPDNVEAMAGLGLSLFNAGVVASDKAQMQEGLNYMTKYIESSPIVATDSQSVKEFKQSVKDAVEYLKSQEKLAPQKVTTPKKKP